MDKSDDRNPTKQLEDAQQVHRKSTLTMQSRSLTSSKSTHNIISSALHGVDLLGTPYFAGQSNQNRSGKATANDNNNSHRCTIKLQKRQHATTSRLRSASKCQILQRDPDQNIQSNRQRQQSERHHKNTSCPFFVVT